MNKFHQALTADRRPGTGKDDRNAFGNGSIDILVRADGVALTRKLRTAVLRKIGGLQAYERGALRARVQVQRVCAARSPEQYRVHVLYEVKGADVSAEHLAPSAVAALDVVARKLKRRFCERKTARLASRVRSCRRDLLRS